MFLGNFFKLQMHKLIDIIIDMGSNYSRNYALDYMRVLGLFLVILAHCGIPRLLFEVRNFDVTMLIFVSAFVFGIGYRGNWKKYFTTRLRRILIPVWTFLGRLCGNGGAFSPPKHPWMRCGRAL